MKGALFIFAALLAGCHGVRTRPPAATATAGAAAVTQTGAAAVPAKAETKTDRKSVPLPAGTDIVFDEKLGTVTIRLSSATTLQTETRTDRVDGPQAFTPPAPPTPSEQADGRLRIGYGIALALGIACAAFGLVRGWDFVMYGGGAVAAGAAFALFIQSHPVLFAVIGGGIALAGGGVWVWHARLKKLAEPRPAA